MAIKLPHHAITPIPNTKPAAVPALWNARYAEQNENFRKLAGFHAWGVCATGADVAAKTIACEDFVLAVGAAFFAKFNETNSAEGVTLDVNATGAKPVTINGKPIKANGLVADRIYQFVYDGTNWALSAGGAAASDETQVFEGAVEFGNSVDFNGPVRFNDVVTVQEPTEPNHPATKNYVDKGDAFGKGVYAAFDKFNTETPVPEVVRGRNGVSL